MSKYIAGIILLCAYMSVAQGNRFAKESAKIISPAGNSATFGNTTMIWTIGETVVFTGAHDNGFQTQGFNQPMICKEIPVIIGSNTSGCALPYTLTVVRGYSLYQWKMGKSIIAGVSNNVYYPIKNASYIVSVGDSTGCFLSSNPYTVDLTLKNPKPTITNYGDTLLVSTDAGSYQWYVWHNGKLKAVMGATGKEYKPLFNAKYYVRANYDNNCESYDEKTVSNGTYDDLIRYNFEETDSTINIKPISRILEHKLTVYPIPAKDKFYVDYETQVQSATLVLNLYNLNGVVVDTRQVKYQNGKITYEFHRGDLPVGKYMLNVSDGNYKNVQGIVLE
ncbi:MAG: T9SS type A sorting domain-containing protein [Cytophagales bacterium]|nr:T9SS type A sorting domain-containing protein [Cytophagales bacterium]